MVASGWFLDFSSYWPHGSLSACVSSATVSLPTVSELPAETPGEGAGVSSKMLFVPVGAVGAQSAGLEPFDLPDFPHDVALLPAALALLVHTDGEVGPGRR